ncbi:hypothetical protein ES708_15779 [subsurface metagenome]
MDTKKFFPDKKRKLIRYLRIALIIIGLVIIIYPFYNNFILARREENMLTSWNVELPHKIIGISWEMSYY